MNRSVEQAIHSLIPQHNGDLPAELVELASSLLAQSRHKASNLKTEEEIGRTYACANIACERLKQSLNLPKIESRPPCPPRTYTKLYAYLDRTLPSTARRRGAGPNGTSRTSTPTKPFPSRPTPTKATSLAPFKGKGRTSKRGLQFASSTKYICPWIQPVVRAVCNELDAPGATPHVLACATSVLTLPSPSALAAGRDAAVDDKKDKLPALITAAFFMVVAILRGAEFEGREYMTQRKLALGILRKIRDDEGVNEKAGGTWDGWEDITTKDVDSWLTELSEKGWLQLDWFANIPEGVGLGAIADHVGADKDMSDQEDRQDFTEARPGLGTMIQDKYDYLSERKRADYKVWKEGIVVKIEAARKAKSAAAAMDLS